MQIGRGRNSCLLGHVTGLLSCFYVKLFLPSVFNSVDFRSSMSRFLLVIDFADVNVLKGLGDLLVGNVGATHFDLQNKVQTDEAIFWCTRKLH